MSDKQIERIAVVHVRAGRRAQVVAIEETLAAMQRLVGGQVCEYMPFASAADPRIEDLAIVCNDEGKRRGYPRNRAIYDDGGQLLDIIRGDFFVCYAPLDRERILPMPEDLQQEVLRWFALPERFVETEEGIQVIRYDPDQQRSDPVDGSVGAVTANKNAQGVKCPVD